MFAFFVVIHILISVALILTVLLQSGKGGGLAGAFGGGAAQTLFGGRGAATFLSKATTVAAIVFMLTSLGLAYLASHRTSSSVVSEMPAARPKPRRDDNSILAATSARPEVVP